MLILLCKVIIIITLPFTTFKTTAETALQNNAKFPNFQKSYFSNFINCTSSFDCEKTLGPSSICVPKLSQCVCKMGFEKKEKKEKEKHNNANYSETYFCEKLVCSRHSECSRIWNMARCSDSNCTCHDDSYFDLNKNYCTFKNKNNNKNESDSSTVWEMLAWVPLASFPVIVGFLFFYQLCCNKKEEPTEVPFQTPLPPPPPQRLPPRAVICHQNQQEPSPSPPMISLSCSHRRRRTTGWRYLDCTATVNRHNSTTIIQNEKATVSDF